MRTYDGPVNRETGKSIKLIEDEKIKPGAATVKVSHSDYEETREFWALMFLTTPASIEAVKGHPRRVMHIHIHPANYDYFLGLILDPSV